MTKPRMPKMNFRDRLARYVSDLGPDACWPWPGSLKPDGYANVCWQGHTTLAHRLAYELLIGPIPEGKQLDHLCRVRHCLNPRHLEPVLQRENIARGDSLTNQHARKTHCPQGHAYAEHAHLYQGRRYCRACARERTLAHYHARKSDPEWYGRRIAMQYARERRKRAESE